MGEKPALVITVDTEADNEWQVGREPSHDNIQALASFQEFCEAYGAKPTYLVTYDVAVQPRCAQVISDISKDARAEIGAHLHPWSTPPLDHEPAGETQTYLYEYPPDVQRAKLKRLTDELTRTFGVRPTSYRAGRWGLDETGLGLLCDAAYSVDTSVLPLADLAHSSQGRTRGGPDYLRAPVSPYHPDPMDVCAHGDSPVQEVPVTAGIIGPMARALDWPMGAGGIGGSWARRLLRKAGLASVVRLQPVRFALAPMLRLAEERLRQGTSALNISLHSSEWVAGQSRGIPDGEAQRELRRRLEGLLEYLQPRTQGLRLSEFAAEWAERRAGKQSGRKPVECRD